MAEPTERTSLLSENLPQANTGSIQEEYRITNNNVWTELDLETE